MQGKIHLYFFGETMQDVHRDTKQFSTNLQLACISLFQFYHSMTILIIFEKY